MGQPHRVINVIPRTFCHRLDTVMQTLSREKLWIWIAQSHPIVLSVTKSLSGDHQNEKKKKENADSIGYDIDMGQNFSCDDTLTIRHAW